MRDTSAKRCYFDILSRIRQPARLVGNEFGAGNGFSGRPDELRVVLAFPDVYEIGISNQAIQILYHLAANVEGVEVERTYLPWVDANKEMRNAGIPLLTLESWVPVTSADILALTLQHELNYTNVLEMLDLAGVPQLASDRRDEHPLVVGGGPAVANFLPMAPFLDAVAVGDGEELFPEMLAELVASKRRGEPRPAALHRLSLIEGVFVPGISATVTRRVLRRLEGAPYPASCLVPLMAGVHDRAWIEVMRGCSRGCRFCQAGMWYRPVRERSPAEITAMASAQLEATGYEELALASLSTSDYSALVVVLSDLAQAHPDTRISLPSLRVDSASMRLAHLTSPTGASVTLAPEAGSQRMRDIINKNVTEAEILAGGEEAFRSGFTTLKLYFMIGLPLEDDADVEAIADLCLRIRDLGRSVLGPKAGRLRLSISVNNFVPKPFTPFQRAAMAQRETLRRRQDLLRSRLRRPGMRLAVHDVDKSYLEAALARGGEEMAAVILEAWQHGARFDSWSEEFQGVAWRQAFEILGTAAEELATRWLQEDTSLPWQVIQGVVADSYLKEEWRRAASGLTTPDCREGECGNCGACLPGVAIDLAGTSPQPEALLGQMTGADPDVLEHSRAIPAEPGMLRSPGVPRSAPARPQVPAATGGRYLLTFAVRDKARFIGHLDKLEVFRRAVRRAGGCLALSGGLRPKPLLSFALPLAVGMESREELCEFELAASPPGDFGERLAQTLPTGIEVLSLEGYEIARRAAARVRAAEYEVEVECARGDDVTVLLTFALERFMAATEVPRQEERRGRTRVVDVRALIEDLVWECEESGIHRFSFRIAVTPAGSARPEWIVEALERLAGIRLNISRITRTRVVLT
ncbi:MAG: TIGR03960 family B12-binding radical SAM protein [Actinobacteria bacterium]|nr:TIGR03960 family B12-binding radical SAM protein [Actinomycetota bacterium]